MRSKIGRKIEGQSVQNTSPDDLRAWFIDFRRVLTEFKVAPENAWNMDETGIALGACANQMVISLFSGLATNACSIALQIEEPPDRALELPERRRGVILSLLIDDWSDTSELKATYPPTLRSIRSYM
jgi:hypothetical protein